jgi:hypothetical protein
MTTPSSISFHFVPFRRFAFSLIHISIDTYTYNLPGLSAYLSKCRSRWCISYLIFFLSLSLSLSLSRLYEIIYIFFSWMELFRVIILQRILSRVVKRLVYANAGFTSWQLSSIYSWCWSDRTPHVRYLTTSHRCIHTYIYTYVHEANLNLKPSYSMSALYFIH